MNTSLLLIIAGCVIVILLVAVIVLWSRNVKMVHKVEFLFQAIDSGDYTFRFSESGDSRFVHTTLNRLKEIMRGMNRLRRRNISSLFSILSIPVSWLSTQRADWYCAAMPPPSSF